MSNYNSIEQQIVDMHTNSDLCAVTFANDDIMTNFCGILSATFTNYIVLGTSVMFLSSKDMRYLLGNDMVESGIHYILSSALPEYLRPVAPQPATMTEVVAQISKFNTIITQTNNTLAIESYVGNMSIAEVELMLVSGNIDYSKLTIAITKNHVVYIIF